MTVWVVEINRDGKWRPYPSDTTFASVHAYTTREFARARIRLINRYDNLELRARKYWAAQ